MQSQGVGLILRNMIEADVRQLLEELIKPIGRLGDITMPGIGSRILKDCDSRENILRTAIEFRNNKATIGFRKWSTEMDVAFERGDLAFISKGLADIGDVFSDIRREFRLENDHNKDSINVRIGISPSVSLNESLPSFVGRLINKRK